MGNRISFIRSWKIACIEYYKWIINPRMIIAAAMILFIWNFAVFPLIDISKEMNSPLNFLEPFIAILNSRVLCLVTPSVFLFLISDYPRLDRNSLFSIHRIKRTEWVLGQFIFFILSAFTYLISIFIFSIIINLHNSFLANGWSLVITRYTTYYPEKSLSFAGKLITKELYNQISPYEAAITGFFLVLMYMVLLSMILLFFHILNLKKAGIASAVSIIAAGSALGIFKSPGMWFFPMAHTMIYLHYTQYLKKTIMKLQSSFFYFIIIIAILLFICLFSVKYTNFLNNDNE